MNVPTIRAALMIAALAGTVAAATACFGMFGGKKDASPRDDRQTCEGLEGALKQDCESRRTR